MRIVYLHGRMSSPNSFKRQQLEKMGHEVYAPKLNSASWEQSVNAARDMIENVQPDLDVQPVLPSSSSLFLTKIKGEQFSALPPKG